MTDFSSDSFVVTPPQQSGEDGKATFYFANVTVEVTLQDALGQPIKGMDVVVLSDGVKVLMVAEDATGRYYPVFQEETIPPDIYQMDAGASPILVIGKIVEAISTGKGVWDIVTDPPTLIENNLFYTDVCWSVAQLADATAFGGGIIGSFAGGPWVGAAIGFSGPVLEGLLTDAWCSFGWDNPVVIRRYHIPGMLLFWDELRGPCPGVPPEDICTSIPEYPVSGLVTDARTGTGINGALISVLHTDRAATSDIDGIYTLIGIPEGYHTVQAQKDGYVSQTQLVNIDGPGSIVNFSLSPEGSSSDEYRFILRWGENPRDLDSHLWLPVSNPYHIYFGDKGQIDGFPYAMLDLDDTTSYGPETTTMVRNYDGTYQYAVHRFAGEGSLTTSDAIVEIYRGDALIQTVEVPPTGTGDWWVVATVDGITGYITIFNYITNTSPAPY